MENTEKKEMQEQSSNEGKETAFSKASRPEKYVASFVIYYCCLAFGMAASFFGPIIIEYSYKFNTEVSHVSFVFTISLVGYLSGALLNGVLNHCINRQIFVTTLFTIVPIVFFICPHVTSIEFFFVLAYLSGLFGGGYDSAQVAWIIDIWRHEAAPFILIQNFAFSLGTIIPPLILSPYLKGDIKNNDANGVKLESNLEGNMSLNSSSVKYDGGSGSDLWIPFTIAGCILLLGWFMQIALTFYYRIKPLELICVEESKEKVGDEESRTEDFNAKVCGENETKSKRFPEFREFILIVLSCCFIAFYVGMEWCTTQFLPTFAHFSTVAFSELEGANLLFGFTMASCIGRGIGIFIVLKAPPHFILVGNIILMTIANAILVLFSDDSVAMMWGGSVLYGFALSTTYPAYFAFIENYLFVSDSVASTILVCVGFVSTVYPLIVGNAVETNPAMMIYVNFFSLIILVGSCSVVFWLTLFRTSKQHRQIEINITLKLDEKV